ncbi:MAG: glycoside hydrolase family 3 C-terminal domain-containing protein [Bacteroidales bacterium]|nr:glycoside hydrolase family 3 C-terminal domain-containing protein [Bacteroidales bacterium]
MKKILSIGALLLSSVAMFAQPQLTKDNIDEVVAAMTLEEKATLLVGSGWGSMTAGSMTASATALVPGAAGTTRAIERLGIPSTVLADGPAGLRISPRRDNDPNTYFCTGFPVGTVLASMWDTERVEELTTAMGNEVLEYGADVLLAPGMNLHRNPLCGRNFEYFSEDPFLTGKTAAAYINGIQSNGVGVSVKHFAANSQEVNRMENDSRVSQRALRELYLKGFEIAVKESDPWTVMSSYNKLNGEYTQQSHGLLTTILRDEWGFGGIVMTDWGTKEGTVKAVNAGNDLMEPGMQVEIDRIIAAVNAGEISQEQLDKNVRNMLTYIVKTPRFNKYQYSNKPEIEAHAKLVREAAPEGMVLLENNGVLPLNGVKTVALYGTGSYDFIAGGTGSGNVNKPYIRNVAEGLTENGLVVNQAIQTWYEQYIALAKTNLRNNGQGGGSVLLGDPVISEMEVSREFIERMEPQTDIAIFTLSRNAGEGGDRYALDGDWTLTGQERQLIQTLADVYHAAGKKFVVVLNIGGVIETASWKHIPDAVLLAWTPGQEGGYAVADILCGKANPSGKLPMTFPVSYLDIPSSANFPYNYKNVQTGMWDFLWGGPKRQKKDVDYTEYAEGIYVGYRYFQTAGAPVSYPFGYGKSYTTFEYSKPVVKATADGFTATITVKNTGAVAGKEAVQLYVAAPAGGLEKPAFELKGFAKTKTLAPGEAQTLTINVDKYALASFNEAASAWETAAGTYKVMFGANAADIRGTGEYKLKKAESWKTNNVLAPVQPVNELSLTK